MVGDGERAARKRRLRIIIAVAVSIIVLGNGFGLYVDRRADAAQANLRRTLVAAAPGLDHEEVLAAWYEFLTDLETPVLLDELLSTENQIAVRAEGDTVIAVYKAGFGGQDLCFDLLVGADETKINERSC